MNNRLKNLYKHLIDDNKHDEKEWHDEYQAFYYVVENMRESIKSGYRLSDNDEEFLRTLLYTKDNGIAARGQSVLSEENFFLFIHNENFLSTLESLILLPNQQSWQAFEEAWIAQGKTRNPVLVNRVAAACTLDVSTTVDVHKFNQAFYWLIQEGILPTYPTQENQDWFSKNLYLMKFLKDVFKDEICDNKTDDFYLSQFVWAIYQNIYNPFRLKKQIIKYGPPGTGKTYQARLQTCQFFDTWKAEYAAKSNLNHVDHIELVQFHPSYSYEDFIEGLRPIIDDDRTSHLGLINGIFKAFCRKAGKWEIDIFKQDKNLDWDVITIDEILPYKDALTGHHWESIFSHQDTSTLVSKAVPPFFFIIDEINRAELSRIFGELMYCLEYRGIKGSVKTQYANLNNEKTGMLKTVKGYEFFIPSNVYLMGTMNTIDRSIESFDFALRRRFRWEEVNPDIKLLKYHLEEYSRRWVILADNLEKLNSKIANEPLLGHDYQVGHAYLMNLNYDRSLGITKVRKSIWDDCIGPLIQEYLRGSGNEIELYQSFMRDFGV